MKIKPYFKALLTYLPEAESSKTTPVSSGYRCDIKFPFDLNLYTSVQNFSESDLVFPGDTVIAEIALLKPEEVAGKIYLGLDFDFYEGFNLIGHGVVTQIINSNSEDR